MSWDPANYASTRQSDTRIEAQIAQTLLDCTSVVNVGCGSGSYEPRPSLTVGIDPSRSMVRSRVSRGLRRSVIGVAEMLPLRDHAVDGSMATLTVHHWKNLRQGIEEMERVTRHAITILTFDPEAGDAFWLTESYLRELGAADDDRFLRMELFTALFSWPIVSVEPVLIPSDCSDGFFESYWARPEMYLRSEVRENMSSFSLSDARAVELGLAALAEDLESGEWDKKLGDLRTRESLDLGYRLVTARP